MDKTAAALLVLFLTAASLMVIIEPAFSSAEVAEDSWSTKAPLPKVEGGIRAAVVDGKIHAIGGSIHFVYDPVMNNWVSKKPMPTGRQYFGIAVCQNKIYTIGGGYWDTDTGWITCNANEVYDPVTDSWEIKTAMPTSRMSLCASEVDGKIYLIGGQTGGPHSTVALNEVYDVATDSWTTKKPIPYSVIAYASTVLEGKIYVISGQDEFHEGFNVDFNQIYDPNTDSWSFGAPLPKVVLDAAAGATTGTLAPKRVYVIGGQNMRAFNFTQVYNPENDSWTIGAEMLTARGWLAVAVVNDLLYAVGGSPEILTPHLTTNEQYTPFGYIAPSSSSSPIPTASPTAEPFPTLSVALAIAALVAVGAWLLVLFNKRKREAELS